MTTKTKPAVKHRPTLTVRQRAFAEALAQGKSQTKAGQLAGYKLDDGALSRTANRTAVSDYVRKRTAEVRESQAWSLEWWRGQVTALLHDAEIASDLPTRARVVELAGRHIGALEPREQVSPQTARFFAELGAAIASAVPPRTVDALPARPVPEESPPGAS